MKPKLIFFASFVLAVGVFLASCQNSSEENRSVVTVTSINGNQPFFSDVLDQGDTLYFGSPAVAFTQDDFVQEDWIPIVFKNRPYNAFGTTGPNQPLSDFVITRYRVEWRRTDTGGGVPPTYNGATFVLIPSGLEIVASVILVPYEVKNSTLMMDINYNFPPPFGSFPDEYLMIATLTFWGHEVGSEREWSFGAEISVNFADPVVESEE